MATRPLIAFTCSDRGNEFFWWCARIMVFLAGGRCRRVQPARKLPPEKFDAIIIGGGVDVDPKLYGEAALEQIRRAAHRPHWLRALFALPGFFLRLALSRKSPAPLDKARDDLELSFIDYAVRASRPLLGICRGSQLMNVYFGGALHQSLSQFYFETPQIRSLMPRKYVKVVEGSRLREMVGGEHCKVNSWHNQAVSRLGDNLVVAAREGSGVVQAIEHANHPFAIGVQWHPEVLFFRREQRAIFRALVRAARS